MNPFRPHLFLPMAAAIAAVSVASAQTGPASTAKGSGEWSWPERMANPQALRADTPPERLREIMRDFTRTLGVRCSHCHVGTDGQPLSTFDFVSDANPRKQVARRMIRMVTYLNRELLPAALGPTGEKPDQPLVNCFTCHRGSTDPALAPPPEAVATPAAPAAPPR